MTRRIIVTLNETVSLAALAVASCLVGCSAAGPSDTGAEPVIGAGGSSAPMGTGTGNVPTAQGGAGNVPTGPAGSPGVGAGPSFGGSAPAGGAPGFAGSPIPGGGSGALPSGGAPGAGGMVIGGGGTVGAGGDMGAAGAPMGCGQGTYCKDGTDIAPPAPADGFQIVSPASITLTPGAEQFWCYTKNIPGTGEVDVGGFQSWMTKGASHHFITFHNTGGVDGQLVSCPLGSGDWVYATSRSGMIIGMDLPQNVGLPFQAGSSLIMNMHLINTGIDVVKPVVKLNVMYAKNVMYKAGSVFSLAANAQIRVPPNGTQTVRGSCTAPAGSKFFLWTTHSHKFTTEDNIDYVSGGKTTNIVHTTDWENPGTHVWGAPDFLTVKAGDSFNYSCTYRNTLAQTLTFGETANSNEMCLAIGYYFPASTASCR
jgi:hypothetical protein